ncbi:uncharacterized protein LOC114753764 [Neltuma alba]|uniref:uncharacterized protein LOC114753764 n=1 Tax=Neltuma alba TaxID=207710 RepID=UPI0010A2B789|nr:uncharacterized protein LOC114753764 [Prosopis alba]
MGQLASQMNVLTRSSLPSDTIPNPKRDGNEECKAISLRSGKQLPDIQRPSQTGKDITNSMATDLDTNELSEEGGIVEEEETKKRKQTEENLTDVVRGKKVEGEMVDDKKRKTTPPLATQMPPLPFPQRFKKKDEDVQFKKFVDMFKQLHINIPFAEALEQMPKYAKFLKDVLSKKKRFGEFETVALTEDCSAILQRKLPPKLRDPGSFYIPCNIGKHFNGKALCDLGASVNLMPLAVFNRLNLGDARPTTVTLLFADRSISYPKGIVEDVLVKVDKFIFPADFIVLDCEVDWNIPIILGRPFLATARTLIDVEKGEITMRVNDEKVIFNMNQALKFPDDSAHCNCIDVIDSTVQEELINSLTKDPLEALLIGETSSIDGKVEAYAEMMSIEAFPYRKAKTFEPLDVTSALSSPLKPSVDEPPVLELKTLPSHLKYAYLGNSTTLPVIVSSKLSTLQEEKLLRVLRHHKKAIGWSIADIKGISPSICMHKILLEDGHKPSIEHQRRLNPVMKEVVKKEILKWLSAGIVYPISDSSWVSPVQCVPKKGGITVVANTQNELVPTRTVTGWRICMDYRKLNTATRKDHFPLPFIDQMLDKLAGQEFFCFLDGYSGYNQIVIAPEDQEKTTFTCPYGT